MNNIKYLVLIPLLFSCAHKKKNRELTNSNPIFNPFIENWKLNNELSTELLKKIKREIPINFSSKYSFVGVCTLNNDINKRSILINPRYWNKYPSKRERYINHLLNLCYNTNPKTSYHYEIPYYGF